MVTLKIVNLVFLCILALSHAAEKRKNEEKGNITVEGTLYLNIPNAIPEPEHIRIMVKVGNQKPAESLLRWKQCAKNKKCQYKVRHIAGNVGQKFAVGVHLNYGDLMGMNVEDDSVDKHEEWTSTILDIKGEVTNQDIHYDIALPRVTPLHPGHDMEKRLASLRTSALASSVTSMPNLTAKELSKNENEIGLAVDVTVHGTVKVVLPVPTVGSALKPAGVFIQLKLNRDAKRHETNVPWDQCTANSCPYAIKNVRGIVGQTYTVGVLDYYYGDSKRDRRNNAVLSKETSELKTGENKQDIKYNKSHDKLQSNVTFVINDIQPHISIPSTLTTTSSGTSSATTLHVVPPAMASVVQPSSTSVIQPASAAVPSVSTLTSQPAASGEPICEYEKETQLPESINYKAHDHRRIAKSTIDLISMWHKKSELNPKPGDIIQYGEHAHVALYLGKDVAHVFGDQFKNYDVLIHMKADRQRGMHIKLHDWVKEMDTNKYRKYNILESKYESFGVDEMAERAKKWVGCKVTNYSYVRNNCEHVAHLLKHGRLESIIENDLRKLYDESDPDNPKTNFSKDDCAGEPGSTLMRVQYFDEIFNLTTNYGIVTHQDPKTIVSKQFYRYEKDKGVLKVDNYPRLVIHFLEAYTNMPTNQLLCKLEKSKLEEVIKIPPASKESHIRVLLSKMKSLWCAEAIKIAPPKAASLFFQCGKHRTHFNIDALVLRDVVQIAKLALKDYLDVITPMIDGIHNNEEQKKSSDNPMLYMKYDMKDQAIFYMNPGLLFERYEGKRCVEEKFLDKFWRSVEIERAPPRPYEIEIVHFPRLS